MSYATTSGGGNILSDNNTNFYYDGSTTTGWNLTTTAGTASVVFGIDSNGAYYGNGGNLAGFTVINGSKNSGIHPLLAFKYIKSKFSLIEGITLKIRLSRLEKAFYQALENGQDALSEKILREVSIEERQSFMYAKGITKFIPRDEINKHKHKVRDGHISDTKFEDFTRVIPKDVLEKKKKVEDIFDGFVIYHYYNPKVEKKIAEKQKMTPDEEAKMRDPILFGWIKENNNLYFIADWDDEYCDLTFDELVKVVGENKLDKYPVIK